MKIVAQLEHDQLLSLPLPRSPKMADIQSHSFETLICRLFQDRNDLASTTLSGFGPGNNLINDGADRCQLDPG
jgi:hypothetical protein